MNPNKAYEKALLRILYNAGTLQDQLGSDAGRLEQLVKEVGAIAPSTVAAHCNRLIKQQANTWERGSNSGNPEYLATCNKRCDELQFVTDKILALFGIAADWGVGLYPTFKVNGYEVLDLTRAIRESKGKVKQ